jgi:ATP-dependent exoDNAse (exonuclease V) alpha subunit
MKTLRQKDIMGGIARLVETQNGFSAVLIKRGKILAQSDGDNAEAVWNSLLSGGNRSLTKTDNADTRNIYHDVRSFIEKTSNAIFLTGRAGTGKTTFLRDFLEQSDLKSLVIAPTGIAALNAGGQTAHSLFKFPPNLIRPQDVKRVREGRLLRSIDILVIDEISMVRADLMDGIDRSLRLHRGVAKPFGGVKLLCVGDSAQLPPVIKNDEYAILDDWFGGAYFFDAPSARDLDWSVVELCHSFRQTDETFLSILNRIRKGVFLNEDGDILRQCVREDFPTTDEVDVILTTTNDGARRINDKEMAELNTKAQIYQCDIEGQFDEKLFPTEGNLELKVGAKVMLLRNDPDRRWVNGTLAIVHELLKDTIKVRIGKYIHEVEAVDWERYQYDIDEEGEPKRKVVGVFTQLPIRPAWALTIHKAQGLTFDSVHIDFGRGAFAHGHTYVALSRCRTLEGLSLSRNLRKSDLVFNQHAFALYDSAKLEDFGEYKIGRAVMSSS